MKPPSPKEKIEHYSVSNRSLIQHIVFTIGRQVLAAAIQLLTVLVIARSLGPEGNGQYAMSILLPTFLSTLLNLGIPAANVYFLGRTDVTTDVALRSNLRMWAVLSIVGIFVGILSIVAFSDKLFPDIPNILLFFGLAAFPPALLQSFLASHLQGLQEFQRFNSALVVGPVITLALITTAVVLLDFAVLGALSAYITGQILSLLITYYFLRGACKSMLQQGVSSVGFNTKSISYGWKAHVSNTLAFMNFKADIFLLNFFLGPSATGIYVIAVQLVERLWIVSAAVSTVVLPGLAKGYKQNTSQNVLTPMLSRMVLLLTSAAALVLLLVSSPLIKLLFGTSYKDAVLPLILLLPGIVFMSFSRVLANDIAARGNPALNMFISASVIVVNVIANIFLIPGLGLVGAAIATSIAYAFNSIVRLAFFAYYSGERWWIPVLVTEDDFRIIYRLIISFYTPPKKTR